MRCMKNWQGLLGSHAKRSAPSGGVIRERAQKTLRRRNDNQTGKQAYPCLLSVVVQGRFVRWVQHSTQKAEIDSVQERN